MNGSLLFRHYSRFLEKVSNMERERNSDNAGETTLELNDELSPESSETTEIDIEGGEISGEFNAYDNPIERHKATTARRIAYLLIGILGGSFVIHHVLVTVLAFNNKTAAMEVLERSFNTWLPVISGLTGAAVAYFFTRERNERR